MPAAPNRRRGIEKFQQNPFHQAVLTFNGTGQFQSKNKTFTIGEFLGGGHFSDVYRFDGKEKFQPGDDNENFVVYRFNKKMLEEPASKLERMVKSGKEQYELLKLLAESNDPEKRFPLGLIPILQFPDFKTIIPYGIKERAIPFKPTWGPYTTIEGMSAIDKQALDDLKEVFKYCYKTNMLVDLSNLGNLFWRTKKENKEEPDTTILCLGDFYELNDPTNSGSDSDMDESVDTFKMVAHEQLKAMSYTKNPNNPEEEIINREIYNYLSPDRAIWNYADKFEDPIEVQNSNSSSSSSHRSSMEL